MSSADTVESYQFATITTSSQQNTVSTSERTSHELASLYDQEDQNIRSTRTSENDVERLISRRPSSSSTASIEPQKNPNIFRQALKWTLGFIPSLDRRLNSRLQRSRFHGWRIGVLLALCMSVLVLCCNIALIIVGAVIHTGYDKDGVADLVYGDGATLSRWDTALHVLINALSTILLAGSNYTMQVLSSPTRADIDKAHAKGNWLEVGVLSLRNLRIIERKRTIQCLILALSSIPLHLFYNASVFRITATNDFSVFAIDSQSDTYKELAANPSMYFRYDNTQWKPVYSERYVSGHGDIYLAIDQLAFITDPVLVSLNMSDYLPWTTNSSLAAMMSTSSDWISFQPGNVTERTVRNPGDFLPQDPQYERMITNLPRSMHIAHAFSKKTGRRRSCVQVSLYFMIVVVTFNALKLAIMLNVLITDRSKYIVTLGDAAASFLERPDATTYGKCLLAKDRKFFSRGRPSILSTMGRQNTPDVSIYTNNIWQPRPQRYFSSVTFDKASSAVLSALCLTLAIVLLSSTTNPRHASSPASSSWAWASSSTATLALGSNAPSSAATLWNAWLVNIPQLLLSFCYLNVNTLFTAMACAREWNTLGTARKGLRVTDPQGEQRSTYFLQLPYRWAVPLICVSGTLHWLLSQTFFLIRIDRFDGEGNLKGEESRAACGISFSSLVVFLCATSGLAYAVRVVGRRKLYPRIPLAECCSLLISAACHPPKDETDTHLEKVKWGVVQGEIVQGLGHCCLSARKVKRPEVGGRYG